MLATHLVKVEIPFAQSEIVAINVNKTPESQTAFLDNSCVSKVKKLKRRYLIVDVSPFQSLFDGDI
ncbi:hypothetical protein [Pseudoalteromonas spongiae]|uniref:hypothetical protein n=1 Tax=Pseudoalteromonas spongiae TaxID=298657 RepID=UPI000C2D4F47|nr:hypothetical protein [Pseudoalteromonas spongiae]